MESTGVKIIIELILFATIGFAGLEIMATSSTTSFQRVTVLVGVVVVSIVGSLAVALSMLKTAKAGI